MNCKSPALGTTLGGGIALKEQERDVFLISSFSSVLLLPTGMLPTFLNP